MFRDHERIGIEFRNLWDIVHHRAHSKSLVRLASNELFGGGDALSKKG
jgi:hypothetical protein